MARKSRRNNNIIEKKQEMMTPEIITGPQLETGVYARLSVEKDNEETIQTQIEMLHQYVEEHGEYHLVDTYVDNGYTGTAKYKNEKINFAINNYDTGSYIIIGTPIIFTTY